MDSRFRGVHDCQGEPDSTTTVDFEYPNGSESDSEKSFFGRFLSKKKKKEKVTMKPSEKYGLDPSVCYSDFRKKLYNERKNWRVAHDNTRKDPLPLILSDCAMVVYIGVIIFTAVVYFLFFLHYMFRQ